MKTFSALACASLLIVLLLDVSCAEPPTAEVVHDPQELLAARVTHHATSWKFLKAHYEDEPIVIDESFELPANAALWSR